MKLPHRRIPERHAFNQNILAAIWLNKVRPQVTTFAKDAFTDGSTFGDHLHQRRSRFARVRVARFPTASLAPRPRPPVFAIGPAIKNALARDRDVLLLE